MAGISDPIEPPRKEPINASTRAPQKLPMNFTLNINIVVIVAIEALMK